MLKDYDMSVHYHPGKANVVGYSLTMLRMGSTTHIYDGKKELVKHGHRLDRMGVRLMVSTSGVFQFILSLNYPWYLKSRRVRIMILC